MFGFKKKIKSVELVSPVNGKMICLKDVPDKVFASEMMGPGVAFYFRVMVKYILLVMES